MAEQQARDARGQGKMIPLTEYTVIAVAALIYNHAYEQDPDTGWLAGDQHSAPGHEACWLEWSRCLLHVLQEQPGASDEQVLALAAQRVDTSEVGVLWDTIPMDQDSYSTISHETDIAMPLVRDFLKRPGNYTEIRFLEDDPAYLAWSAGSDTGAPAGVQTGEKEWWQQ